MTTVSDAFGEFADKLQAKADVKIDKALALYNEADDTLKRFSLQQIDFTGEPTEENLREYFDTLELIDSLDSYIENMEREVAAQRKS